MSRRSRSRTVSPSAAGNRLRESNSHRRVVLSGPPGGFFASPPVRSAKAPATRRHWNRLRNTFRGKGIRRLRQRRIRGRRLGRRERGSGRDRPASGGVQARPVAAHPGGPRRTADRGRPRGQRSAAYLSPVPGEGVVRYPVCDPSVAEFSYGMRLSEPHFADPERGAASSCPDLHLPRLSEELGQPSRDLPNGTVRQRYRAGCWGGLRVKERIRAAGRCCALGHIPVCLRNRAPANLGYFFGLCCGKFTTWCFLATVRHSRPYVRRRAVSG